MTLRSSAAGTGASSGLLPVGQQQGRQSEQDFVDERNEIRHQQVDHEQRQRQFEQGREFQARGKAEGGAGQRMRHGVLRYRRTGVEITTRAFTNQCHAYGLCPLQVVPAGAGNS